MLNLKLKKRKSAQEFEQHCKGILKRVLTDEQYSEVEEMNSKPQPDPEWTEKGQSKWEPVNIEYKS